MYASNGDEPEPPLKFMPASAAGRGLIVVNGRAYAASTRGCGSVTDGVWSVDLASKEISHWDTSDGIAGAAGFAFGPDGTVYVATTAGKVVSLDGKTLALKNSYDAGSGFTSSPLTFSFQDKTALAATTKDGNIHIIDGANLTPLAKLSAAAAGALTTFQDADGTRWFLAPGANDISAWKLGDTGGALSLTRGWSHKIDSPQPAIVMNGVLFAVSGGARATLYAMEAFTGRDLWNSGDSIGAAVDLAECPAAAARFTSAARMVRSMSSGSSGLNTNYDAPFLQSPSMFTFHQRRLVHNFLKDPGKPRQICKQCHELARAVSKAPGSRRLARHHG